MGWAALILAAAYAAYYISADVFRVGDGLPGSAAYALGNAADMGRNLLTYLGWTLNVFLPTVRNFSNAVDPAEAYRAFRGRDARIEALMRDRGFPAAR